MSAKILDLPMGDNDAGAKTIRDYLKALLAKVWEEGESFSGKRPFGNSGWYYELYTPLVKAGAATGKIDEDGLQDCDSEACEALIAGAIAAL